MPEPKNAAALLAILEPHKEMLREMEMEVLPVDGLERFVFMPLEGPDEVDATPAACAARIVADVCREWLDQWCDKHDAYVRIIFECGECRAWITPESAKSPLRHCPTVERPTRFAAILALTAWARSR